MDLVNKYITENEPEFTNGKIDTITHAVILENRAQRWHEVSNGIAKESDGSIMPTDEELKKIMARVEMEVPPGNPKNLPQYPEYPHTEEWQAMSPEEVHKWHSVNKHARSVRAQKVREAVGCQNDVAVKSVQLYPTDLNYATRMAQT